MALEKPDTFDFDKVTKAANAIYTSEQTVKDFSSDVAKQEELSELVDQYQSKVTVPRELKYTPPVATGGLNRVTEKDVADLSTHHCRRDNAELPY